MSGANPRSNTGTRLSCVGLTLRITVRLAASSSYSTSSTGIEVTFPAPSTSPTPPDRVGVSWPSPAVLRASRSVTPGSNHTSPVNPDSSRLSTGLNGKTCARTRLCEASVFTPSRGLPPLASLRSESR